MKRKFLAVILPLIGCATVVGSGFSAWYFGQEYTTDASLGQAMVDVTGVYGSYGNFTVSPTSNNEAFAESTHLFLDQDGRYDSSAYDESNRDEDYRKTGLVVTNEDNFTDAKVTDMVWDMDVKFAQGSTDPTLVQIYDAKFKVQVEVDILITSALASYVTVEDEVDVVTFNGLHFEFDDGTDYNANDIEGFGNNNSGKIFKAVKTFELGDLEGGATSTTTDQESNSYNITTWGLTVDFSTKSETSQRGTHINNIFKWTKKDVESNIFGKPTDITEYNNMLTNLSVDDGNTTSSNSYIYVRAAASLVAAQD